MLFERKYEKNDEFMSFIDSYCKIFPDEINKVIANLVKFTENYEKENNIKICDLDMYAVFCHMLEIVIKDIKNDYKIKEIKANYSKIRRKDEQK